MAEQRPTKRWNHSRLGSPNKATTSFREALAQYCKDKDVDPHWYMVDLIADPLLDDVHLKFQAAKELAQYLQPKLRTVEVTGNPDAPLQHVIVATNLGEALHRAYETTEAIG